jgi:hypothetical protein
MSEKKELENTHQQAHAAKQARVLSNLDVENWSEEDIQKHMTELSKYYGRGAQRANLYGNFSWDKEYDYHVHTRVDNPMKLERRLKAGWSFATKDDALKGGLDDRRVQDSAIFGDTCIEIHCGNCQGILLKIPKKLRELNFKLRERIHKEQSAKTHSGTSATITERDEGVRIVRTKDEGTVSL